VINHILFLRNGVLYPWFKLDLGQVHVAVAVMPDFQHPLDLITEPPPFKKGFLPPSSVLHSLACMHACKGNVHGSWMLR
jgi:hypothetical protein